MALEAHYSLDVGNLCITDTSIVSGPQRSEDELLASATRAVKKLVTECLALPKTVKKGKFEGRLDMLQLPFPVIKLPREKAPPKPKPLTAWQKFALKKGIDIHRKKTNSVFDEERQMWVDKWGKRAREDERSRDWLREMPDGYVAAEDGGDPFLDDRREKQARLSKQKKNEDRNKRREELMSKAAKEVGDLNATVQKLATASNGKFEHNKIKKSKGLKK